ncbi:MAG: GNAT family N-acetyltransferase, partial [Bacteroidales bacterium]|nr:GNAT family N-acetyltransferase [Bacteroidales bacterium]MBR0037826.1 GNAT family N-acetyltransferase [Bacteroidales bacterium]
GCERGLRTFHLGGGVGAAEDSLYRFKASFKRKADYRFSVGKEIFDERMYEELVRTRMELDSGFNRDGSFFPVYRFQM